MRKRTADRVPHLEEDYMFRRVAIIAGLSAAPLIALAPAASAQSVTFSIGSGSYYGGSGYNGYGYSNPYSDYGYAYPQYYGSSPAYGYNAYTGYYEGRSAYDRRAYEWAQRRRAEQLERWQRERERRSYREREHWNGGDDNDNGY